MKKILNVEGYDLYRTNIFSFLDKKSTEEFQHKMRSPKKEEKLIFEFMMAENQNWEYQITMTPEFHDEEFRNSWLGAVVCFPIKKKKKDQSKRELEDLKKEHEIIKEHPRPGSRQTLQPADAKTEAAKETQHWQLVVTANQWNTE